MFGCSQQANTIEYKAFLTIAGVLPHSSSCKWMKLRKQMDLWCDRVLCVPSLCVSDCVSCWCQGTFYIDHLRPHKAMVECWGGGVDRGTLTRVAPRYHLMLIKVAARSMANMTQCRTICGETKESLSLIVSLIDTT